MYITLLPYFFCINYAISLFHNTLNMLKHNKNTDKQRLQQLMTNNSQNTSNTNFAAIILAAGKGTRMKSDLPKVLHKIANRPMVAHVANTAMQLSPDHIIVVTSPDNNDDVLAAAQTTAPNASSATQNEQLGTAHAVGIAEDAINGSNDNNKYNGTALVLYGDTPLIKPETLDKMLHAAKDNAVVVLGMRPADAGAYGRLILADDGSLERIVEYKDATEDERAVTLCNSGVMAVANGQIFDLIRKVGNENASGEYYLTDIVGIAREMGQKCAVVEASEDELIGVNSRVELAEAERIFQAGAREKAMIEGATLTDPNTVYFSADTKIGRDVIIGPNVFFGEGVQIANGTQIKPFSHIEGDNSKAEKGQITIAENCSIGPFARLRAGTKIGSGSKIGNFVEIKNSQLGNGVKAGHLTYLGDATIGENSNIGAGTITCNYDGIGKYQTIIGKDSFIGSDATLVAPVSIGEGAFIGAGSCITSDVESHSLALTRSEKIEKQGWAKDFLTKKK